ncbi:TetR family transcriptional regulator [Jatrophihabitans sp.]|uniref:TetR/AcrR family transcriptional regulator n=1 Tax=Jatrophihabitans sp. TaxID=1932789 RepID=UPI0030C6916B
MTTRLPLAQRRAQLVATSLGIATTDGIGAVTVRRVADEAGVALGVVHYCFDDKDALLAALAERIVSDLAEAGAEELGAFEAVDLPSALRGALAGLWASITATRDAQLLTYEITTQSLRQPSLRAVADRQYVVSQAAAEALLALAAEACGAQWAAPLSELGAEALAFVDGVTLRWLVDGDSAGALARLSRFADYLGTQAVPA